MKKKIENKDKKEERSDFRGCSPYLMKEMMNRCGCAPSDSEKMKQSHCCGTVSDEKDEK
ncbi:MAG: hypothetical protein IIB40_11325 [Candidatus Marinimicrobia bacterium]|nr:hypothetical protein [Candidatus Neomarinimicrobiota bacterium]